MLQFFLIILCAQFSICFVILPNLEHVNEFKSFMKEDFFNSVEQSRTILITGVNNDLSKWLLWNLKNPVLVQEDLNIATTSLDAIKIGVHIRIVSDVQDFQNNLTFDFLKICKNLILIIRSPFVGGHRKIEELSESLWKIKFLNFLILFYNTSNTKFEVTSYNPFSPKEKLTVHNNLSVSSIVFQERKPLNLQGHKIVYSVFNDFPRINVENSTFYGSDVYIINSTISRMNVKTEVIKAKNGTWNGIAEDINTGRADFSLVNEFISSLDGLDWTYPFSTDGIMVIVPKGGEIPKYFNLFFVFSVNSWITLFITMLVLFLILNLIQSISKFYLNNVSTISSIELIRITVNQPTLGFRRANYPKKVFLIFFIFFSVIMSVALQSSLTGVLATPKYYKDINNLEELKRSNLKILIFKPYVNYMRRPSGIMYRKFVISSELQTVAKTMLSGNLNYAYTYPSKSIAQYWMRFTTKLFARQIFHMVPVPLIPHCRAYFCIRNSPYLGTVDRIMLNLFESGSISYDQIVGLSKGNLMQYPKHRKFFLKHHRKHFIKSLSLEHTQTAFYILLMGYVLSIFALVLEIAKSKI